MSELFEKFVDTTLPADQFHHQQHVQVAWMFVRKYGMPAALAEFSAAIKRFADAKGVTGLYHETITWAFLLLIAEREGRQPSDTWEAFAATNADLLSWKPSILERYYSSDLLKSEVARRTFVFPNMAARQPGASHGEVSPDASVRPSRRRSLRRQVEATPGGSAIAVEAARARSKT